VRVRLVCRCMRAWERNSDVAATNESGDKHCKRIMSCDLATRLRLCEFDGVLRKNSVISSQNTFISSKIWHYVRHFAPEALWPYIWACPLKLRSLHSVILIIRRAHQKRVLNVL
jgi:hypothetical protein